MNTRPNTTYLPDENVVLSHFFTNTDQYVYAATDALPVSVWGLLAGGASRSSLTLRDRFLNVFLEDSSSYEEYLHTMMLMARHIGGGSVDLLQPIMERAAKFMEKFAIGYGHNSLKDSCYDRVVVDLVSIRVAKLLEESPLGAFQEKSTRYVNFETAENIIPSTTVTVSRSQELLERERIVYNTVLTRCQDWYESQMQDIEDPGVRTRTAKAKAFDTARYVLLASKPTALAFTMPSRESERHIARLLAHENAEVREIAARICEEVKKVNPSLIVHVQPNPFQAQTVDLTHIINPRPSTTTTSRYMTSDTPNVKLVSVSDASLLGIAAGVVTANQNRSTTHASINYSDALTALFASADPEEKSMQVLEARLAGRGKHDELPREFGFGEFVFDIVIDYGAYRDLQRHRVGTQIVSDLRSANGFTVPSLLNIPGFEDVRAQYVDYMYDVEYVNTACRSKDLQASEYWFALGNNVKFTYACNFKQLIYLCELRTTPQGHECYRNAALSMYDQVVDLIVPERHHDRFRKLFRVHAPETTDRRAQEQRQSL